ncbi:hypothetical protein [Thalassorhabdomicrobium marinisediminis]|uniref:hypothetical protein n=1 Tax=Thalassorhabdomicrobium marinisediminis TaxID=2170577 RepID=UPI0018C88EDC|nr:hypothetical protein [Thalassorhabdomicrobium marinisediminis]
MNILKLTFAMTAVGLVSACSVEGTIETGLSPYDGPDSYIAVANDMGRDSDTNANDNAAIAVTPDGCQAWVIDDGVEGRASNRLDPVSGLPVCQGTPGVVYGPYQSGTQGLTDYTPNGPVPTRQQSYEVRP